MAQPNIERQQTINNQSNDVKHACQEQNRQNNREIVPLDQLHPGQAGAIVRVGGQAAARRRLLEMGLVRGETIFVERVAPLGDPVEFTIKGYHLSLRRRDAAGIEVQINGGE